MPPTLTTLPITVTFNPQGLTNPEIPLFTFSGSINSAREIQVPAGIGMITLNLVTEPFEGLSALFQTSPIQWFAFDNPNSPVPTPDMFMVQRITDFNVTIVDFNSVHGAEQQSAYHRFNVVVAYNGQTYGTDPTIINEPEDG